MKGKILWMLLSFLLVAALVLASCGEAVGEQEEEEEEPAVGEPQYGGTLTFKPEWNSGGVSEWDRVASGAMGNAVSSWGNPYLQPLFVGDIEGLGPRGTGETPFQFWQWVPEQYNKGLLAESWELTDPTTLTVSIRPGIMWTGNTYMGVEPRELTAYDVEYGFSRIMESYAGWAESQRVVSITATDRYTVVFEFTEYYADWMGAIFTGHLATFPARETVEAGGSDWQNQMGTGPFILTDWVEGAHATFDRNPNYWETTTINGKEYPLPFVDTLVWVILPDEATKIAAIRTGAVDWDLVISLLYSDSLADTSPELIQDKFLFPATWYYALKCDQEPFSDRNVRRALMIGTDLEAIATAVFGEAEIHAWPVSSAIPWYTPMDELPESAKVLFSNDPALAKQMIIDAGYPDGFAMTINVDSTNLEHQDAIGLLTTMWAEFNVTVNMEIAESAVRVSMGFERTYEDALAWRMANRAPYLSVNLLALESIHNIAGYDSAYFKELFAEGAYTVMSEAERSVLFKELFLVFLEDMATFPLPQNSTRV